MPTVDTDRNVMRPDDIIDALRRMIRLPEPEKQCFALMGPPGIGKSAVPRAAAEAEGAIFWDVRGSTKEPTDVSMMLPNKATGAWEYQRPAIFPPDDGRKYLVLLDEIDKLPPAMQNAFLGVIWDRESNGHKLGPNVTLAAAMNRAEDRSHSQKMSVALMRRMIPVEFEVDVQAWLRWAVDASLEPLVIAYIQADPERLHKFDPMAKEPGFASPATWHDVSKMIAAGFPTGQLRPMIRAKVGKADGIEFTAFMQTWQSLPSWAEIVQNPDTAPVPDKSDARFSAAGMVAKRVTVATMGSAVKYLQRMGDAYTMFGMSYATRRDRSLCATREYVQLGVTQADLMF